MQVEKPRRRLKRNDAQETQPVAEESHTNFSQSETANGLLSGRENLSQKRVGQGQGSKFELRRDAKEEGNNQNGVTSK